MLRRLFLLREHVDEGSDLVRLESVAEWRHVLSSVVDLLFDGVLFEPLADSEERRRLAWDADPVNSVAVFAAFFVKENCARRRVSRRAMDGGVDQGGRRLNRKACQECNCTTKDEG